MRLSFPQLQKKRPDEKGVYSLDTWVDKEHDGYLLYVEGVVSDFAIKGIESGRHDIAEFYIIPKKRGSNLGELFAHEIFRMYKGEWQARQIEGAHLSRDFCRKAICSFTDNNYSESTVEDAYWGTITKQVFKS